MPVHTVSLASTPPPDASIRAVRAAGAAVAHQPLPLTIQIGCDGGLACDDLTVTARELLDGGPPALLASGVAHVDHGLATVELTITLDRAGSRIVEVAIQAPDGDAIPENDRRLVAFDVARDRVRVLHVAGRPTYDVRALRMWLKSDASVDVVAFFILRTRTDDVNASEDDLALIPFPVHELFSEHLPSFDAVVLQDFNAAPYELLQHLPALARYVEHGGGLIMVGGPDSFAGGHYAGTRLADVLPVELEEGRRLGGVRSRALHARLHRRGARRAGAAPAPELQRRRTPGDGRAPTASATRAPARSSSGRTPRLKTPIGAPMPLLALGEKGDGRAIALAIDGTYRLGVQRARLRDRGARARRALGRPARLAHARSALRAGADRARHRLHGRRSALAARAPAAGQRRASQRRSRAPRAARGRRAQSTAKSTRRRTSYHRRRQARARRLQRARLGRNRPLDAPRFRVRTRRRRVGRLAPRRGALASESRSATGGEFLRASDAGRFRFPRRPKWPPSGASSRCLPSWTGPSSPRVALGLTGSSRRRKTGLA